MSKILCHYHTDQEAEITCAKCNKPICPECNHSGNCTICHLTTSSYVKTTIGFIGSTLFFLPFFGGAAMLIAAIINSGFFWFLILFSIAWIGGVAVGYVSILASFFNSILSIRKERQARKHFANQVGVDKKGNRIHPYYRSAPTSAIPSEICFENFTENQQKCTNLTINSTRSASIEPLKSISLILSNGQVFCYKCGKILPSDAQYCLQCGVPLNYSRLLN
ncbi:hypothetical protein NEF87_002120 [Candidatus Lokiarchaeum ossiferum]|uniref:B box-type domain-containing protein n=1 Tax=Candidatus Lokiarchaeum ossiferum TaxID=2951803 RepID=A0ABY6HQQ2_9ARCH|nr:hypothetical protein NEF87_002120 [Candidatus Lokiarchaeum sp. B-35]